MLAITHISMRAYRAFLETAICRKYPHTAPLEREGRARSSVRLGSAVVFDGDLSLSGQLIAPLDCKTLLAMRI